MAEKIGRFSRRTTALFWCFAVVIILGFLIYWEQIALLYVLTTVALVALLLIISFADLENVGRDKIEGFADRKE
jgi:hypothetical protein